MLGIVCDSEVAIYRANTTLAQATQMYLTFGENLQICRTLSQIAEITGKTSEELTRKLTQLHAKATPNMGYGISYTLDPLSEQEIATVLKSDPFVLLNLSYTDAKKLQLSNLPVRMERTDFNIAPGWRPEVVLNFGAHSRIVKVSDNSGKTGCLKVSRYLNDPDQDKRIAHEARILHDIYQTGLWKDGIPGVVDSDEGWSVLEYVPGYPARDLLRQFPVSTNVHHKGLERNIRLGVARQAAETTDYLRTKCKTTHGDITMDNIIMEMIPDGPKVTVVDFEHAKSNPAEADMRKDIHMLYETIFEILTGKPPTGMAEKQLSDNLLMLGISRNVSEDLAEYIRHPEKIYSAMPLDLILKPSHRALENYRTAL